MAPLEQYNCPRQAPIAASCKVLKRWHGQAIDETGALAENSKEKFEIRAANIVKGLEAQAGQKGSLSQVYQSNQEHALTLDYILQQAPQVGGLHHFWVCRLPGIPSNFMEAQMCMLSKL